MGGQGSTRWHSHRKAITVEGANCLPVRMLALGESGEVTWTVRGRLRATAHFRLHRDAAGAPFGVKLRYVAPHNGAVAVQQIEVLRRHTEAGIPQVLWVCACGQAVRALYRPRGADRFACRHCHALAYASCQQHDKNAERRLDLLRGHIRRQTALLARVEAQQAKSIYRNLRGDAKH